MQDDPNNECKSRDGGQPVEAQPVGDDGHTWDRDGERCVKCGDKERISGIIATNTAQAEKIRELRKETKQLRELWAADVRDYEEKLKLLARVVLATDFRNPDVSDNEAREAIELARKIINP